MTYHGGTAMIGFLVAYMAVVMILGLIFYVYSALTLMFTAKKLGVENAWLAWIPIANLVLMSKMANKHWWPVLLLIGMIIPFLNIIAMIVLFVFVYIWMWNICEARGRPGWLSLLTLIPFVGGIWGFIMWGILAWGE